MKIGLVSSHGGHLTELLELEDSFEGNETFYITYEGKTPSGLKNCNYLKTDWFKNPIRFFSTAIAVFKILNRERPKALFSTGSEIALPVFFIGKLFFGCKLIYVECSAQVSNPSITGRIIYHIADKFFVQWERLLAVYGPKAEYKGGLI